MNTLCCIGHITRDKIVTPERTVYMSGGVAYYFSYALACLPRRTDYTLVTKVAREDFKTVEDMRAAGINVVCRDSKATVFFENTYTINDVRSQRVLAKSDPFTTEDVRGIRADIFHLGTLLADDFSLEVLGELHRRGRVSVDAQGFLRRVEGGEVGKCDWADKEAWLRKVDIVKVNEMEMEVLTGESSPRKAATIIAGYGPKEVLVTLGALGSLILADGEFITIPSYPPTAVVDSTGCGDTYMAGYLYCRVQGIPVRQSACFAAAMCTSKIAHNGPFSGTTDDIRRIAKGDILI
ncbi:MAG: PfkB family carbohydrate kinase [Prevotella sp.]|nr:PfkB family carbohydrate kinase [Prevotella sp.]